LFRGCLGCILCQKRLMLSWKLDECKPLHVGPREEREEEGCARRREKEGKG